MRKLSDEELMAEVKIRLEEKQRSLQELLDLTRQLQQVNHKLKESEAIKSHFLSNIRNEINNPLTAILVLSEIISAADHSMWEKSRDMAERIHHEAFELDFQLRNIFAAAELESGDVFPEASNIDVDALIRSIIDRFAHKTKQKRLTVHYNLLSDVNLNGATHFKTDPSKLQIIIINVLANAVAFSNRDSEIGVTVSLIDNQLHISIQDSGIGIDPAELPLIYNRFTQLDFGITKNFRGHGLGLSICKDLIDILGGNLLVQSIKNVGSTFTVVLPELSMHPGASFTDDELLFGPL